MLVFCDRPLVYSFVVLGSFREGEAGGDAMGSATIVHIYTTILIHTQ